MQLDPLIGVAFWMFLAIIVVAGIWLAKVQNRETQKTIRLAIEKDVQLDPAIIDKLIAGKTGKPEGYYIGGIITTATGIGLPVLGYFIGRIAPTYFYPIAGAGILVTLIGFSLIGGGMIISRREKTCKNGNRRI
jgi:hypothetical protein